MVCCSFDHIMYPGHIHAPLALLCTWLETLRSYFRQGKAGRGLGAAASACIVPSIILVMLLAMPLSAAAETSVSPSPLQYGPGLIGAPTMWSAGYTGANVTIAMVDTGLDITHPAFAGKVDPRSYNVVLAAEDEVYSPTNITNIVPHGTHTAGVALASGSSEAPGIAYDAGIVVLRGVGWCNAPGIDDAVAASIHYFASLQNVMVLSSSYALALSENRLTVWPAYTINPVQAQAALEAVSNGKIVVAAVGNDRHPLLDPVAGRNPRGIALFPFIQPANAHAGVYDDGGANYDFSGLQHQSGLIIAVTAVGADKTIATYANALGVTASWGLAAPGGNSQMYGGTDPDITPGIYSTFPVADGSYGFNLGTSEASPAVSGSLALLQQASPDYNAQDLAHVLFATAENVGGQPACNGIYGYGLVRPDRGIAGPTSLAAGSAVDVASQSMTYWSRPLVTDGSFIKTGPGYLIIAGRTTAGGDVTVAGGALAVDGTLTLLTGTSLNIASGGTLAGFGWIYGNTTVEGSLRAGQLPNYSDLIANNSGRLPVGIPLSGTSPGTLTFYGNVALAGTATTCVNVDGTLVIPGGPGTYDKFIISGSSANFQAGGTLAPVLRNIPGGTNSYTPDIGTTFPFLTVTNGATVTGSYTSLTQPASGLPAAARFDALYSPAGITLVVTPRSYAGLAATQPVNANLLGLAGALDRARPVAGQAMYGSAQSVFGGLYGQDQAGSMTSMNGLAGQGQASTPPAALEAMTGFAGLLADRQAWFATGLSAESAGIRPKIAWAMSGNTPAVSAFPVAATGVASGQGAIGTLPTNPWNVWGLTFGRWSHTGAAQGLPGASLSSGGCMLGLERVWDEEFLAGAAFGYTRGIGESAGLDATLDTFAGSLYATWTPGPLVLSTRVTIGPTETHTSRSFAFSSGSASVSSTSHGWGGLGAVEAGYRFRLGKAILMPFAGLTDQEFLRQAFSEKTGLGLRFPDQTFSKLTSELGVRAATLVVMGGITFKPRLSVSWVHDFGRRGLRTETSLLGQSFTLEVSDPGRDAAVVGVDLEAWKSGSVAVFSSYKGEFREHAASHQGMLGLRFSW